MKPNSGVGAFVYGKYNLTNTTPLPPIQYQTSVPGAVVAASDGTLFIAASNNDRILVFPSIPPTSNLPRPVAVFGQPDLFTSGSSSQLNGLNFPRGLYYDEPANCLWVADTNNNRVLRYSNVLPRVVNNSAVNVDLTFDTRSPNFNLVPPGTPTLQHQQQQQPSKTCYTI